MSDLQKYINTRKQKDLDFAKDYDIGYQDFKIGEMLKQARKESGLTQEEVANALHTKKSAISRIENHAQDIRLSTLQNFAQVMGRELRVQLA
jgi:DNA-binding XRE family transcriptional regulator